MNDLISIIVPVYKVEKFLDRCVKSVINQIYKNIEIILVDDGSPDRCPQMCDDWAKKDFRIKVIHQKNAGLSEARNSGIEISKGEYIMFVDSDDWLTANAAEALYKRIVADGSDLAIGKHTDAYENGETNGNFCKHMKNLVLTKQDFLLQVGEKGLYSVSAWAKLYRKNIFDDLRYAPVKLTEDLALFPSIIEKCGKISTVDELVYYYFRNDDSLTHQKRMTFEMCRDDVTANLAFSRYLLEKNITRGASAWYLRSISIVLLGSYGKELSKLTRDFYTKQEIKELMKYFGMEGKIKFTCLYFPKAYQLLKNIKQKIKSVN